MSRRLSFTLLVVALSVLIAVPASADPPEGAKPDFNPHIYADGEAWGTKVTTTLPAPTDSNRQSFDGLYVVTNSNNAGMQLPVGEAGPGNPKYNGGRWWVFTVTWTEEGFDFHGTVPLLKSYEDIMLHQALGHLTITEGSPAGGPPPYFSCPLLPVK